MKSPLIFIFLVALTFQLSAQCEYEFNGIDELERAKKVITKDVKVLAPITGYPVAYLALGRLDTNYFINLKLNLNSNTCFDSECEMTIVTDSGSVVVKKQSRISECSHRTTKDGASFEYLEVNFNVSKKQLIELKKKELRQMKITSADGKLDINFGIKNQNKNLANPYFKENVKCILIVAE